TLFYSLSGTQTASTGHGTTGNQGVRCSQHLKSSRLPLYSMECGKFQIPPDLVVKTQAIDIVEVIAYLLRRSDVAQTSWRTRTSRCERLSPSEAHWSTTKFDGM